MNENDVKRISRLTAIVTQLQTKRLLTAAQLADRFNVSIRTIYRDVKALEQAGIPILTEEGKGYTMMEGYRLPPVSLTENEARALVTVEQILVKNTDSSLSRDYEVAISKIKAILKQVTKNKVELLADRIAISPAFARHHTSDSLTIIQNALTSFQVLEITYRAKHDGETTERQVEPFALYFSLSESWLLIAYCRLRNDFRMFSLDRILKVNLANVSFQPHQLTLAAYLDEKRKNFSTPDIPLS